MKLLHHHHDVEDQDHNQDHNQDQQQKGEQQVQQIMRTSPPGHQESGWKRRLNALQEFWAKVNNDWVLNFAGLLAYNLLLSIFPILLVLLAVAGFILDFFGSARSALVGAITNGKVLPSGVGATIVPKVLDNFTKSSGLFAILGILMAAYAGSRLFIVIASCFNVIFRLRPRDALHQNLMAFGMMALFTLLVPFVFLSSSVANIIAQTLFKGAGTLGAFLIQAAGVGAAVLAALILFAAIYIVVPNRPVHVKEVWRGTLTGAALLVLYELVFPLYQQFVLKPNNYGTTAGFAIVILVFFYYFAFILLLGAEVNSWFAGQRATASGIAGIIHEVQAHDTTRGAAGPTAGLPQEDLQSHEGKAAMRNNKSAIKHERVGHKHDEKPPKFTEATSPNPRKTAEAAERTTGYDKNRPSHRPEPGKRQNDDGAPGSASDDGGSAMGASGRSRRGSSGHDSGHDPRSGAREAGLVASSAGDVHGQDGRETVIRGPSRPEYAHPLPPEGGELPQQKRRGSSGNAAIAAAATAAIPVLMWLLGRNQHRTS